MPSTFLGFRFVIFGLLLNKNEQILRLKLNNEQTEKNINQHFDCLLYYYLVYLIK